MAPFLMHIQGLDEDRQSKIVTVPEWVLHLTGKGFPKSVPTHIKGLEDQGMEQEKSQSCVCSLHVQPE
jgi:hypothetical protein